jgi:beta-lactamase regulating signal transducer with metallopeptidase domain
MVEIKDPNSLDSQAIDNRVLIIPAILILGIVGVVVFLLVKLQRAKIKVKEEKKKLKMERRERDRKKGR